MPTIGIALLAAGYLVPLRGGGIWDNLAFGVHGRGIPIGLETVGSVVRTVGTFALLTAAVLIRVRKSMRSLPIGIIIAAGVLEGLNFLWLLSIGPFASPAPWLGLIGSVLLLIAGRRALGRVSLRERQT